MTTDGTALATAPATTPRQAAPVGRLARRVAGLRRTTPGRLMLFAVLLVTVGLLAGAAVAGAAVSAASGAAEVGGHSEPLLLDAETIYSSLADADATAAQAFLAGGLEPAALTARYNADVDRAGTALAEAASRAAPGSAAARTVAALSSGVPRYAGLVATARADNRQGFPVGAAYLSAASRLNRTRLLPQAQTLFRQAQRDLADGYASARSDLILGLLAVVLLGLLAALLVVQRRLSRTTRRTVNVPLAAATVLAVALTAWSAVAFVTQHGHLDRAESAGSTPIDTVARARILALQERGDEGLTLVARGADSSYEADFAAVRARLAGPGGLLAAARSEVDGARAGELDRVIAAQRAYLARHDDIRARDDRGDFPGAVAEAIGPADSATFGAVTDGLARVLDADKAAFAGQIDAAGRGLGVLAVLGPLLALAICALAWLGLRARLEEYR